MLASIVSRTELIVDRGVLERVDDRLAERAPKWARLSEPKIEARINAVIAAQDPEAVRIREQIRHDREVGVRAMATAPPRSGAASTSPHWPR